MKAILNKVKHSYRVAKSTIREKSKSKKRNPQWDNVRDEHVLNHPTCAACGSSKRLQVHHIQPFHLYPELELEPTNLITLCMDISECHLSLGHGDNFRMFNPDILNDINLFINATEDGKIKIIEEAKLKRKDA